jgi:hypothetical protein
MTRTRRPLRRSRVAAAHPWGGSRRRERGDVPGWVLITLMTAALVTALWAVAEDQLVAMFRSALASVGG